MDLSSVAAQAVAIEMARGQFEIGIAALKNNLQADQQVLKLIAGASPVAAPQNAGTAVTQVGRILNQTA